MDVKVTSLNDFILVVFWDTIAKPEKSNPSFGLKEKFEAAKSLSINSALLLLRFCSPMSFDWIWIDEPLLLLWLRKPPVNL